MKNNNPPLEGVELLKWLADSLQPKRKTKKPISTQAKPNKTL
jgi:hypothetical protein